MTNANIKIIQQDLISSFMNFSMIVFNLKDLRPSINYKEEITKNIAQNISNYLLSKHYKKCFMGKNRA